MRDIQQRKRIGLVAHDHKKGDLVEWARFNRDLLASHELIATGTTGTLLARELGVPVRRLHSGPLGGDLQIGAMIAEGEIDFLVFFWDPLEPQPHDPDVKALLRIAVVWNIPVACDRASADFMISSPLMTGSYQRTLPDYSTHLDRLAVAAPIDEAPASEGPETPPNASATPAAAVLAAFPDPVVSTEAPETASTAERSREGSRLAAGDARAGVEDRREGPGPDDRAWAGSAVPDAVDALVVELR